MAIKIVGTAHGENHLEYILKGYDSNLDLLGLFREDVLDNLRHRLKSDHGSFVFSNPSLSIDSSSELCSGARQPSMLAIEEPDLSALARVEKTLYPGYNKLVISFLNWGRGETIYGQLVKGYLDGIVRRILPSAEQGSVDLS